MTADHTALFWDALKATDGEIPWPALEQFADALLSNPPLIHDLEKLYDEARAVCAETRTFADLYVAAILALAAPRLGQERRREIAPFIVQKLMDAGETDDDGAIEVLTATCGMLGPDCLPAVLVALSKKKELSGAWFSLWSLLKLTAKTTDPAIRARVIQESMKLLREADSGRSELLDAIGAAHVLAEMNYQPCRPLLQRLAARNGMALLGPGDMEEALVRLDGKSDYEPLPDLWEEPVQKWFEPYWRMARDGYEKNEENENDEEDENSEDNEEEREDADLRRASDLVGRFLHSPFAAELPEDCREDAGFIADSVLRNARNYVGANPEDLDEAALREVLLEAFPRKVTARRELFENVAPVTQALLRWLGSEGILRNSEALAAAVGRWADRIVTEAMNPRNWDLAKGFAMCAKADGVDMSDPEAMRRYMLEYNSRILEQQVARQLPHGEEPETAQSEAPATPRVGRNEPCPCGSGRKYKKCCGASGAKASP